MSFTSTFFAFSTAALVVACADERESSLPCADCAPTETERPAPTPKPTLDAQGEWILDVGRDVRIALLDDSTLPFVCALRPDGTSTGKDVTAGDTHYDARGIDIEDDRVLVYSSFADEDPSAPMTVARVTARVTWTSPTFDLTTPVQTIPVTVESCRRKMQWLEGDGCIDVRGVTEQAERRILPGKYHMRTFEPHESGPPRGFAVGGKLTRLFQLLVVDERATIFVNTSLHYVVQSE